MECYAQLLMVICGNTSDKELQRVIKLLCHGHARYEMELNQIMTGVQGSVELAPEKKTQDQHFAGYLV